MPKQLPLPFLLREATTFDNFYPGKNSLLLHCLERMAKGEGEKILYLWGQAAVGRTHLLQACCQYAHKFGFSSVYLPLNQKEVLEPALLQDLEHRHLICIDDIQCIANDSLWEEALFHLYNRMQSSGNCLLIAGNAVPIELNLQLADLISRLNAGLLFHIQPLTDEEKLIVLQSRAKERGFDLPIEVGHFLLVRYSRELASLFQLLEQLDKASLAAQRKLTIPFLKEVLAA
jgi:DnaA family protein